MVAEIDAVLMPSFLAAKRTIIGLDTAIVNKTSWLWVLEINNYRINDYICIGRLESISLNPLNTDIAILLKKVIEQTRSILDNSLAIVKT